MLSCAFFYLFRAAGPADEDGLPADGRRGLLWDACRKFVAAGWVVDTAGYSTGFRVTLKVRSAKKMEGSTDTDAQRPMNSIFQI